MQYFTNGENTFSLFFSLSYLTASLVKHTWHILKYLKQPLDGFNLCNWTHFTGRHYYCTHQAIRHTFIVSTTKCPKPHSTAIKNINKNSRDQISTETLYWLFANSCTYCKSMRGIFWKSKFLGMKHHCQSTGLLCNISDNSEGILLFSYRIKVELWREWLWLMRNG